MLSGGDRRIGHGQEAITCVEHAVDRPAAYADVDHPAQVEGWQQNLGAHRSLGDAHLGTRRWLGRRHQDEYLVQCDVQLRGAALDLWSAELGQHRLLEHQVR
jgi:hypothetical protein